MTELKKQGFSYDQIVNVKGHKSSDSVAAYQRRKRHRKEEVMNDAHLHFYLLTLL